MKIAKTIMMLLLCLTIISCDSDIHPIETKPLSQKNPTDYEFDLPLSEVREKLIAAFEDPDLRWKLAYSFDPSSRFLVSIERKEDALRSIEIFADPNNKDDLYLHSFGEIIGPSPIYFSDGKPLEYRAEFQLHLTDAGNNHTKVSVITHNPHVINGSKCCGPHGSVSNNDSVEPTTIEEYKILLFIGSVLGAKDMPPLIMPEAVETQVDKQKILEVDEFVSQVNQTFEKSKKVVTIKEWNDKLNDYQFRDFTYTMKGKEVETLVVNYDSENVIRKNIYYFKNNQLVYAAESEDVRFEDKIINIESSGFYFQNEKLIDYHFNHQKKPKIEGWDYETEVLTESQRRLKQLNQQLLPK